MQHIEFFHQEHFNTRYHRKTAKRSLSNFIEYFWEIKFDELYQQYPEGFSDALFPNIGYTYLINLGTPFTMQLEENKFELKSDGFLPRHKYMVCHHSAGNKIFGIKFRVSPIIFEKKINFFEYREYIFPLAYLIDRNVVSKIKTAPNFQKRVEIISAYYDRIIDKHAGSQNYVNIVTEILAKAEADNKFNTSIEDLASSYNISSRTLQRYFEAATGISAKKALQIMRIRKAVGKLTTSPESFHYSEFGYYDYSHFYKHLRQFLNSQSIEILQPHLKIFGKEGEGKGRSEKVNSEE